MKVKSSYLNITRIYTVKLFTWSLFFWPYVSFLRHIGGNNNGVLLEMFEMRFHPVCRTEWTLAEEEKFVFIAFSNGIGWIISISSTLSINSVHLPCHRNKLVLHCQYMQFKSGIVNTSTTPLIANCYSVAGFYVSWRQYSQYICTRQIVVTVNLYRYMCITNIGFGKLGKQRKCVWSKLFS